MWFLALHIDSYSTCLCLRVFPVHWLRVKASKHNDRCQEDWLQLPDYWIFCTRIKGVHRIYYKTPHLNICCVGGSLWNISVKDGWMWGMLGCTGQSNFPPTQSGSLHQNYNTITMTRNYMVLWSFVINLDSCGADLVVGGEGRFECVINITFVLDKHSLKRVLNLLSPVSRICNTVCAYISLFRQILWRRGTRRLVTPNGLHQSKCFAKVSLVSVEPSSFPV